MTEKEKLDKLVAEIERRYNYHKDHADDYFWKANEDRELLSFIDSMQKEPKECMYSKDNYTDEDRKALCEGCEKECEFKPTTSVWHDAKDTPVASKTKIVLYTNGKWDMFKAYETKDDYDNYWAGVNQALEEKGVLVKRWAYVEDLLKL